MPSLLMVFNDYFISSCKLSNGINTLNLRNLKDKHN